MSFLWINGHLIDKADAKVSPFDHGFLYGDGVWEHFRVFGGKVFRPEPHVRQLFATLGTIAIDIALSESEFISAIETTARANNRTEGYVRVIVTRGPGTLGPDPRKLHPQVIIIAEEYQPFPAELYEHGLHASIWGGYDPTNPTHHSKFLGPHHLVWAKQTALKHGCLEAIIFWREQVIGGIEGKLLLVRKGTVKPLLCGGNGFDVMVSVAAELASAAGFPVDEDVEHVLDPVTHADLLAADEVFLAGTTCGIIGIVRIDGRDISGGTEGPVTRQIRERYRELVRNGG